MADLRRRGQIICEAGLRFLEQDHLIRNVEAEIRNFFDYYSIISEQLDLGLTEKERNQIARDRACNMGNYIPYPGIAEVLDTLSKIGTSAVRARSPMTTTSGLIILI